MDGSATMPTVQQVAPALLNAGYSVTPVQTDGSKRPAIASWKALQSKRMTAEVAAHAFRGDVGIGIIGGAVSGNLEILDVESRANWGELAELIEEARPGLLDRLPRVATPSGGMHIYYRCAAVEGNQKLASRADADGRPEVLIETRGEGGYVVTASSPAACHPSGKLYRLVHGRITKTPTITVEERDVLLNCARSFNSYAPPEAYTAARQSSPGESEGKPGTDYAAQADVPALLETHGWAIEGRTGDEVRLRRPGKKHGISAVWNHGGHRLLYVFSSNAAPFDPERGYGPFSVYGFLEHGGDFRAAARQLASEGFGDPPKRQSGDNGPPPSSSPEPEPGDLDRFRTTDLGNAELLSRWYRHVLRYVSERQQWIAWDGTRWKSDTDGAAYRIAAKLLCRLLETAERITDEDRRKKVRVWAVKCEDRRKIEAMLALARYDQGLIVAASELDANPLVLNVANGTLCLKTGRLRAHDPSDLITKLSPVIYDEEATCPIFHRFMQTTFAGNSETIRYVQGGLGYSLSGSVSEQCLFIPYGPGANGKSTLLGTVEHILGDYALSTPAETLLSKHDGIPSDVARLEGARFVVSQETEDGRRFAESRLKALTGGDTITARRLYCDWQSFEPTHKLWLATNHKPSIKGTDAAIWRRIRLIPFTAIIPEAERDHDLLDKLKGEASAILKWMLIGCIDWQKNGLPIATEVTKATAEYRNESDLLGAFIEDACVAGDGFSVSAAKLYGVYRTWTENNGEECCTNTAFGRRMTDRGFKKTRRKSGFVYSDIGVKG